MMKAMMKAKRNALWITFLSMMMLIPLSSNAKAKKEEVNVYSYRQKHLIQPMLDLFAQKTGIKVNVLFANEGLAEKLEQEGRFSPADLVLTTDISRLLALSDRKLVQAYQSEELNQNIPSNYRAPNGEWFGLTVRARVLFTHAERTALSNDISYLDLAKPEYKGKICMRSGKHSYNLSLIAAMIAHYGYADTKEWLTGVKSNLARSPQGNERNQIQGVSQNICDIAIGNTYYLGVMQDDPKQRAITEGIQIKFPDQKGKGTHVNLSGAAIARYAPNLESAKKLLVFFSQPEAQYLYAELNHEYPVNPKVKVPASLSQWGTFKADDLPLSELSRYHAQASKLVDDVRFDL